MADARDSLAVIVQELVAVLPTRMVSVIAGTRDTAAVRKWQSGASKPRHVLIEKRLRDAHTVVALLLTQESPDTVRAWFIGMNPELDDVSAAEALRADRGADVIAAARAFMAHG